MIIKIHNFKVNTIIGVHPHEKIKEQPLSFNIKIDADLEKASVSDDVNDTIDYTEIGNLIDKICQENNYDLLEKLAKHVGDSIIENNPLANKVKVEILKPLAVEKAENTSVTYKTKR